MSGLDLDAIDLRVEAATPPPWTFYNDELWRGATAEQLSAYDDTRGEDEDLWPKGADTVFNGDVKQPADANFIAHARQDVPALAAAVRAVLDLHRMVEVADYRDPSGSTSFPACGECHEQEWPCPTVKALS